MAISTLGFCSPNSAAGSSTWSCRKLNQSPFRYPNLWSVGSNNWISRKVGQNSLRYPNNILRKLDHQKSLGFPNLWTGCGVGMTSTTRISDESVICRSTKTSPWLMLPPISDGGDNMVYQFYSLGENKVVGINKRDGSNQVEYWPHDDAKIVGSSRGWLALFHEHNCDLFLYNPISRRQVKLPPIKTLPDIPQVNLSMGRGCVTNVVISSSSPDEEDCRAMMIYGPEDRLAFCCPGRSTEWTPLGDEYQYESFVYSTRQKLFFCMTKHKDDIEAWDLRDPLSPRMVPMEVAVDENNYPLAARSEEELQLKLMCEDYKFLAIAEQSDQLFHVRRFVLPRIGPDGSYVDMVWYGSSIGYDESVPYKTVGFDIHKYDPETGILKYMDRTLDGMALFIGCNDGFALSAADFPDLKPNSIYYTDTRSPPEWIDRGYGGHDVGIFNYEDQTFSSCYYPCGLGSIKRIVPNPKWFTPSTI